MVVRLTVLLLALASLAEAHPGRLGVDGCHVVRNPRGYTYRDGTTLPAGDVHCHRRLDQGMKADGSERLREPSEESAPEPDYDLTEAP